MTDDNGGRRRYPLEPLARIAGVELGVVGGSQPGRRTESTAALAEALGISRTMAKRLNRDGLNERQADKYAIALGHHPSHIWPDWWDVDELSLERDARHPDLDDELDDDEFADFDTDDGGSLHDLAF